MVLALAAGAWVLGAHAQVADEDGGARLNAGIDLRLVLDDGTPEFRTGFDLDLISATRTQRLSFSGDFGVTVPLEDIETAGFSDPRYGISYLRDTGRSRVEIGASLRRQALDRVQILDPDAPFEEADLITTDGGTLEQRTLRAAVELGLNDPFGMQLSYTLNQRLYEGTTDPDLLDTTTETVAAGLRLDVDPALQLTLNADRQLREQGNPGDPVFEERERVTARVGVAWQMRPNLGLDAGIGMVRIDTDTTVLGVTTTDLRDGLEADLALSLDRPNGGYRFNLSQRLSASGEVTSLDLARDLNLPGDADISVGVGLTELPSGNVYGTGALSYSRDTRSGALSFSLRHAAAVNSDDDEVQRTIAQAGYNGDLPRGARWSLSGQLTNSAYVQGTEPDIASARLSLSYARPLTEDWDLSTGVTWRTTREDGADQTEESTLFLSLERRFTFRR